MKYFSTRGGDERLTFEQAVLRGLAPNGGLYIPEQIPSLPANWETEWASLSFPELSYQVLSLYIPTDPAQGGIPSADLKELVTRSYATFRHADTTPLKRLDDKLWCLELWHGPTFAFKDVALQLLGNLFEYFLHRRNQGKSGSQRERLTIVGATSGDTGSAAIQGVRSKQDISIFILHPKGRVSPIQEAQMTTVLDDNVHNVAVEGTFDDCQDVVKALFSDAEFNAKHRLGAVNSINWARIMAQIVYYFSAYFQFKRTLGSAAQTEYVVPTGNFGDILAGYYAKQMGLPLGKLVVATNENDILQRFWASGRYEKSSSDSDSDSGTAAAAAAAASAQTAPTTGSTDGAQSAGGVKATLSPAMDILVSSNFERLLWYLAFSSAGTHEGACARLAGWMGDLKASGRVVVSASELELARRDFAAERVSDAEIKETLRASFQKGYLIDPHTAVGFKAAQNQARAGAGAGAGVHQIILSTAHPAKFAEAVEASLQNESSFDFTRDVLPAEMVGLLEKERRVLHVKSDGSGVPGLVNETKALIEHTVQTPPAPAPARAENTRSV